MKCEDDKEKGDKCSSQSQACARNGPEEDNTYQ